MTLAEFIGARLTAAGVLAESAGGHDAAWILHPDDTDSIAHAVMWQPGRVLALVEAGWAILELHRHDDPDRPCFTLRALGLVWADHPDYDDGWRPT